MVDGTKPCSRCGEVKSLSEFYRKPSGDPVAACKACALAQQRAYREANRGWRNARKRELRALNPEPDRARSRAYKQANRERILADARAYNARHAEENKAYQRAYYQEHKAELAVRQREYERRNRDRVRARRLVWERADRLKNPEKYATKRRRYYEANPDAYREKSRRYRALKRGLVVGEVTATILDAKWSYWGGLCWMCGAPAVEWDHVKPLSRGGAHCLANLRPACRSCNARKNDQWPLRAAA